MILGSLFYKDLHLKKKNKLGILFSPVLWLSDRSRSRTGANGSSSSFGVDDQSPSRRAILVDYHPLLSASSSSDRSSHPFVFSSIHSTCRVFFSLRLWWHQRQVTESHWAIGSSLLDCILGSQPLTLRRHRWQVTALVIRRGTLFSLKFVRYLGLLFQLVFHHRVDSINGT